MDNKLTNAPLPKHIQLGQILNMHMGEKGEFFITIEIVNDAEKISKKAEFLIDTGFNGFLQVSKEVVSALKLDIAGKDKTTGFDGVEKEVGIVKTKIKILDQEIWNFPIQVIENGRLLIGTSLLKDLGKMLIIDYRNERMTITDEPKVQKKVHKTVDKYSR